MTCVSQAGEYREAWDVLMRDDPLPAVHGRVCHHPRETSCNRTELGAGIGHCIAHGFDLQYGMRQQNLAVASGYWPLFRYDPAMRTIAANPFRLDSPRPAISFRDYACNELRYKALAQIRPAEAEQLMAAGQAAIDEKYRAPMKRWPAGRRPASIRKTPALA